MVNERFDNYFEDNEEQLKRSIFNNIKNLKFNKQVFAWYIVTRQNPRDVELYGEILDGKNLKNNYKQIIKNIRKNGNPNMSYNSLINLYISKSFNKNILKPMCKAAFNKNYSLVRTLARLSS